MTVIKGDDFDIFWLPESFLWKTRFARIERKTLISNADFEWKRRPGSNIRCLEEGFHAREDYSIAEEGNGWNDEDLENKVIKKMTLNKGENFGLQRRLRWETWVRLNGRLWFHKLAVNAKWNFGRQVQIQRRQCLKMKIEIKKRALSTKMTVNKRENFDWEKLSMENKVNGKLWFQKPSLNTKKILG